MVALIEQLIDAYNRKDLAAFVACWAHDAEVYELGANEPVLHGASEIHTAYAQAFTATPALESRVITRIAHGDDIVVDKERVGPREGGATIETLTIYKIKKGLITQAWYAR